MSHSLEEQHQSPLPSCTTASNCVTTKWVDAASYSNRKLFIWVVLVFHWISQLNSHECQILQTSREFGQSFFELD